MKPQPSSPGLVRALGPVMATAVVVGTVIGSGVFKKPQSLAANVEFSGLVLLVWVTAGVLVLLGALAYAEVAVLLPRAGGNYVFLREAYGRLAGFLSGWVDFLIIRAASLAALATIFAESYTDLLNRVLGLSGEGLGEFWFRRLLTVGVVLGLALVNVRGVRWGGWVQVLVTTVKVGSLLFILALPLVVLLSGNGWLRPPAPFAGFPDFEPPPLVSLDNLRPFWPDDWGRVTVAGLATAFLGVLWAYHGWMNITPVAEEVRNPQRNLPLSLLGGVGLVIFLYVGANVAYYMALSGPEMARLTNTTVVAEFGQRLLGPAGSTLASAAVMISVFGALNGLMLIAPRLLYAMGEDGLAPLKLRAVHPRFHTPANAILVMAVWAALLILAEAVLRSTGLLAESKSAFDVLTDFAMFGVVTFETMAVLAIFVFRRTRPDAERPYRCWGYPVVPLLYVLLPGFVLWNYFVSQQLEAAAGTIFILAGVVFYYLLGLQRSPFALPPPEAGKTFVAVSGAAAALPAPDGIVASPSEVKE
jgi:amino acid transporter